VILDFRLNPSDFERIKSDEITSIKLLKEIKKEIRNSSIIFSATNKVWYYHSNGNSNGCKNHRKER
jgi:hypothetical protein